VIGRMGAHDQMTGVSFTALYRERISFIVRVGHPLLTNPALADIQNWPVVYPSIGAAIRPFVDQFMRENGIGQLPHRIETVSGAFGRIYLQNSDAVWIISDSVVANEVERGILARLPFETDTMLGPVGVMEREDWIRTQPARLFRRTLQEVIQADGTFTS